MELSPIAFRRVLFIYTAIFVVVTLVLLLGVIEPLKVEAALGDTREIAVKAFYVITGYNFLSAVILFFIATRSTGQNRSAIFVIGGIIMMLLGIMLADAASAYKSHGAAMQDASVLIYFCAMVDLLTGVLLFITAFVQPKNA
jgi:hypothetical protein